MFTGRVLAGGLQEYRDLLACERADFVCGLVAATIVAAEAKGRVRRQHFVLDGLRKDATQGPADVLGGLRAQTLLAAPDDKLTAVGPGEGGDRARAQLWQNM